MADVKEKPVKETTKKATKEPEFYAAVGRRKEASARVRLYTVTNGDLTIGAITMKAGDVLVNNKPVDEYFRGETLKKMYLEPFRTTNTLNRFATTVKVIGGGTNGQMSAMIHAISRALLQLNEERFRPILKKRGFLTRDPRTKQRRNVGQGGRARARKQSPKR